MTETTERPTSARDVLRKWYADHPGLHRCTDVAADLWDNGVTFGAADRTGLNHKVATFSLRISDQGQIERHRVRVENLTQPVTMYGLPNGAPFAYEEDPPE